MKTIRLDGYSNITISDEAYALIVAIVTDGMICGGCKQPYSKEYPQVAVNLCLTCFLRFQEHRHLAYVGEVAEYASGHTYAFSDAHGYIYLSHSSWDAHQCSQSTYWTVKLAGFPLPEQYDGNELSQHDWHVYGKFQTNSVIIVAYREDYGEKRNITWILSKDGTLIEINKRKKLFQTLFKKARERLEATRDAQGYYHVGDYTFYQVYDSHLFEIVSDMLSEDQQQLRML